MRKTLVIVAAIVALAAAIVATAPASLVGVALARASGGALTLAGAEGTLWRGSGTLAAGRALRIPLAWSLEPWPLARGELRLQILPPTPAAQSPRADVAAREGVIAVRALDVSFPAEGAADIVPGSGIRLAGDVRVTSSSLDRNDRAWDGSAQLSWQDARVALGNEAPLRLGTVRANLAAAADRLSGPLTNEGGDVDVRGALSLGANGLPDVSLTMTPRRGDPAQARTLSLSARPDGSGWAVDFRPGAR